MISCCPIDEGLIELLIGIMIFQTAGEKTLYTHGVTPEEFRTALDLAKGDALSDPEAFPVLRFLPAEMKKRLTDARSKL